MSDSSTDNGTEGAFVFPEHPQNATLQFTIKAEEVHGEGLFLSASMTPGDQTWDHQAVEEVFRQARSAPHPGAYVFEMVGENLFRVMSFPEKVSQEEVRRIILSLLHVMRNHHDQLVQALQAFPNSEVIEEAARKLVFEINMGSLERSKLEVVPVVDARKVEVEGIHCVHCGFGLGTRLAKFLAPLLDGNSVIDDGTTEVGNLKFAIRNRDGRPVVQVGYLNHDNNFSAFLNGVLADRVRAAIQAVAMEVMTGELVRLEDQRRMIEWVSASVQATYQVDPATITARVDVIEAEVRAKFAKPFEEVDDHGDDDLPDQHAPAAG